MKIKYKILVWEVKKPQGKWQQGLQHSHSYQTVLTLHTSVQSTLTQLHDIQDRDDMRAGEIKQHLGPGGIWTQNATVRTMEYEFSNFGYHSYINTE
jgi:hypothetical protein